MSCPVFPGTENPTETRTEAIRILADRISQIATAFVINCRKHVLWHGEKIAVLEADEAPPTGVDTPEDLERVRKYFLAVNERK